MCFAGDKLLRRYIRKLQIKMFQTQKAKEFNVKKLYNMLFSEILLMKLD